MIDGREQRLFLVGQLFLGVGFACRRRLNEDVYKRQVSVTVPSPLSVKRSVGVDIG